MTEAQLKRYHAKRKRVRVDAYALREGEPPVYNKDIAGFLDLPVGTIGHVLTGHRVNADVLQQIANVVAAMKQNQKK